jgi:hypothetical protein
VHEWRRSEAIRGHQRPSEAIRGDQRRSEAIRGDQRRSEAIRGDQKPAEAIRGHQRGRRRSSEGSSKAIRGVVEEAHRQTCLLEWHSRAQEDASGVAGLLEVIVRVAVGTILEKRGYLARRDLRGTIEQLTFEGANIGRIRSIRGNQRADSVNQRQSEG